MAFGSCAEAIESYLAHLRGEFAASQFQGGCLLSTPFVRPDGEGIELEVQILPSGRIQINDLGNTLGYLYINGITLNGPLMANARLISKAHGVSILRNRLSIEVDADFLGMAIQGLIQASLGVVDLIHKRRPTSRVNFDDEVESVIIRSGVAYDVGYIVPGKREQHTVRFHVNSGRNLLLHPLSPASASAARSWAERLAYRFTDILNGDDRWYPYAILDDRGAREGVWSSHALVPLAEYAIMWSQRDSLVSALEWSGSPPY